LSPIVERLPEDGSGLIQPGFGYDDSDPSQYGREH
jgi:hypothetical protein